MRYAMLIFALLGTAGSGFLGGKWLSDYNKNQDKFKMMEDISKKLGGDAELNKFNKALGGGDLDMGKLRAMLTTAYLLLGGAALGLVTAAVTFARAIPSYVGGILLLLCAAVPAALDPKTLIFTGAFLLAGLFALLIRRRPTVVRTIDPDAAPISEVV